MDKLVEILGRFGAPVLAAVIGGPAGAAASAAVGALAGALGTPATPSAVQEALAAKDPEEARALIKEIEERDAKAMLEEMRVEIEDRANARAMQMAMTENGHWTASMPAVLTIILAIMFSAALGFLFLKGIPESQLALLLVGALISEFRGALGFFFGTTAGSKRSGDTVRAIASQGASTGQIVGQAVDAAVKAIRR